MCCIPQEIALSLFLARTSALDDGQLTHSSIPPMQVYIAAMQEEAEANSDVKIPPPGSFRFGLRIYFAQLLGLILCALYLYWQIAGLTGE